MYTRASQPRRRRHESLVTVTVRVPASASNLGAGFDCLGLALDMWLEARLVPGAGPPVYSGTLEGLHASDDVLLGAMGGRTPKRHRLEVHSDIPVSRGLGSSGAAAVAGIVLRQLIRRANVAQLDVFHDARRIEKHPDNVAPAVFGGLVLALDPPTRLPLDTRHLGVACAIPDATVDTAQARRILPVRVSRNTAVEQAARAAALTLGLARGDPDLIRSGMQDVIAVPKRAPLIPGFGHAVDAGVKAGAYGVTISGSGSTLVALCPKERAHLVAKAMADTLRQQQNPAEPRVLAVTERGYQVSDDNLA